MKASEAAANNSGITNTKFIVALGKALLALTLSAILLLSAFLILSPHPAPSQKKNRVISGNELSVVFGGARKSATAMQLGELSKDGRAILAHPIRFNAQEYPFLQYTILDRSPGQSIFLLWRTKESPKQTSNTRLYWNGNKTLTIDLGKNKAWKGEITELAFDVYGDLRGQPIEFDTLTLKPYSSQALLASIWAEWTAYRGWTQRSAHHLRGTQTEPALSPTLVAACWAGLALLLLAGANLLFKSSTRISYLAAVLIPWVALDLLWQGELSTQLTETKVLFSGKTQHEKQLADRESALYEYAQHLKNEILPEPGARIFLLEDTAHRTYTRLKAQYYLLPHNLYNYDRIPRKNAVRNGDYILVLGKVEGLEYSAEKHRLNWLEPKGEAKSISAEKIDEQKLGTVYKVTGGGE